MDATRLYWQFGCFACITWQLYNLTAKASCRKLKKNGGGWQEPVHAVRENVLLSRSWAGAARNLQCAQGTVGGEAGRQLPPQLCSQPVAVQLAAQIRRRA
jgi:hypothetical protein